MPVTARYMDVDADKKENFKQMKRRKKILCLALSMILSFSISACQPSSENADPITPEPSFMNPVESTTIHSSDGSVESGYVDRPYFSADFFEKQIFSDTESHSILAYFQQEDLFYIMVSSTNEKITKTISFSNMDVEIPATTYKILIVDSEGKTRKEISLNSVFEDSFVLGNIRSLTVNNDGVIYLANLTMSGQIELFAIDENGSPTEDKLLLNTQMEGASFLDVYSGDTDTLYTLIYSATGKYYVSLFDYSGNVQSTIPFEDIPDTNISDIALTGPFLQDGERLYILGVHSDQRTTYLFPINQQGTAFEKSASDKISRSFRIQNHLQKSYTHDEDGIYSIDLLSFQNQSLLEWKDTDIQGSIAKVIVLSEKKILLSTKSPESLLLLTQEDHNPHAQKKIITIGGFDVSKNIALKNAIYRYNLTNDDCRIEIQNFEMPETSDASDIQKALTELQMDFHAGNMPDILYATPNAEVPQLDFLRYGSSGLLSDIHALIQQDAAFHDADYYQKILYSPMTGDKLYYIFPFYAVEGLLGLSEDLETRTGWSHNEFDDFANKWEQNGRVPLVNVSSLFLLKNILSADLNLYVNHLGNSVLMDTESFYQTLEFCKKYGNAVSDGEEGIDEKIETGVRPSRIDSLSGLKTKFNRENEALLSFIGYPSENKTAPIAIPLEMYAISSGTLYQESCWEFLRTLLSEEHQQAHTMQKAFPVLRSTMETILQEALSEKVFTETAQGKQSRNYFFPEDAQMWRNCMENIDTSSSILNDQIIQIITEEAQAYFSDEKTLPEVVPLIQNRVSVYMNQ